MIHLIKNSAKYPKRKKILKKMPNFREIKNILNMKRKYCLALDLKDDPTLIEAYKHYHAEENFRPEITDSIKKSGVTQMEIYLTGNRLFMIMEVDENFDFGRKAKMDAENPQVQEWESLVSTFQKKLPWAKKGEKWVLMEQIFIFESKTQS
jgi:L-rhamnose mutarotase